MAREFSKELRLRLKDMPGIRPFVCDGNPLESKIFIVGFNPATAMKRSFIEDWRDDQGFNKSVWLDHYIKERSEVALNASKRKPNKFSNTRARIDWITEELSPIKCLETNLYSKPTRASKELKDIDRNTELFEFLFDSIKPRIIFLHGIEVRKEIERVFTLVLPENVFSECELWGKKVTIIPKRHLSRGWSKEVTKDFAKELRSYFLEGVGL